MNKSFFFLLVFLFLQNFAIQAQSLDWGINLGGHVDDYPVDIHKVPGGIILSSTVDGLHKYDTEGKLLWKFNFFSNVYVSYFITSTDVDEKGNIYATIRLEGTYGKTETINDFDFLLGVSNLVKIDPQGELLWVRPVGGNYGLVKYWNRNVYFIGGFQETISVNKEVTLTSLQYYDCFSWVYRYGTDFFLSKFSDIGVLEKVVQYGNDYHDYAASMQVDEDGNVFIAGVHQEYSCVDSFSYMLRFDNDLNLIWEKKLTTVTPINLFLSENGRLYVISTGFYGESTEESENPNNLVGTYNLMEYDPVTSDFLRLNSYAKGNWNESFAPPSPFLNNIHLQDYKGDLIIFTSANRKLNFENKEFVPQPKQENLLLFRVNKKTFQSSYITHFEAELPPDFPDYAAIDNPGRTLVDGDKLFITAAYQASPLHMFGEQILNNSGNNNRDILLAKIDLSALAGPNDDFDDDKDGVLNYKDYCPDTPLDTAVDARGCSSVQNDLDSDGVTNTKDICPNTRDNVPVDENGCEILQFPTNNFIISSTSESCIDSSDASIRIEVKDKTYEYFLRINDEGELLAFNDVAEITGLPDGSYKICISVTGYSPYEKCFNLKIASPAPLSVFSVINNIGTHVQLQLSGGEKYIIQHNERLIQTSENHLNLLLEDGPNHISVRTGKDCQGIYQEMIFGGQELLLYPNPVESYFKIENNLLATAAANVMVYTYEGQLLISQRFEQGATLKVDVSGLATGIYLVRVAFQDRVENFKIIKK